MRVNCGQSTFREARATKITTTEIDTCELSALVDTLRGEKISIPILEVAQSDRSDAGRVDCRFPGQDSYAFSRTS